MLNYIKTIIFLAVALIYTSANASNSDIEILTDIPYGEDKAQKLDVYLPHNTNNAPVIFMIHGGAWSGGDKANKAEFENKVAHWVSKGFVFISTNYRTLPQATPIEQSEDVAAALLFSQKHAHKWAGSSEKFILMGHSSGAHLVSLISSNFNTMTNNGVKPWLGTISLDISGYDIVKKVKGDTPSKFYQDKFGHDLAYLQKSSPFHVLTHKIPPFLAICSTQNTDACEQASNFITKAKSFGSHGELISTGLSHNDINSELGKPSCYTQRVDDFLKKLNSRIKLLLTNSGNELNKCTVKA